MPCATSKNLHGTSAFAPAAPSSSPLARLNALAATGPLPADVWGDIERLVARVEGAREDAEADAQESLRARQRRAAAFYDRRAKLANWSPFRGWA